MISQQSVDLDVCGGRLPTSIIVGSWVVHVFGCSVSPTGTAEVILTVDESGKPSPTIWRVQHTQYPPPPEMTIGLSRYACEPLDVLIHGIRLRCEPERHLPNLGGTSGAMVERERPWSLQLKLSDGRGNRTDSVLLLARRQFPGPRLYCVGATLYGIGRDWVPAMAKAWRGAGFATSIVFARSQHECSAVELATPGVVCETRSQVANLSDAKALRYFDQGINQLVCLGYARAASTEVLALGDLDEAPPSVDGAIDRALADVQHGPLAAVRLFFNADDACPAGVCPTSDPEWRALCLPRLGTKPFHPHWKSMVAPERVHDVSVHFWLGAPGYMNRGKDVWGTCLQVVTWPMNGTL